MAAGRRPENRADREEGRWSGGGTGQEQGPQSWGLAGKSAVRCYHDHAGQVSVSRTFPSTPLDQWELFGPHLNMTLRPESWSPLVQNSFTLELKKIGLRSMERITFLKRKFE